MSFRPAGYEEDSDEDEYGFDDGGYNTGINYDNKTPNPAPYVSNSDRDSDTRGGFGRPQASADLPHHAQNGAINGPYNAEWIPKTRQGNTGKPVHIKTKKPYTDERSMVDQGVSSAVKKVTRDRTQGVHESRKPECLTSNVIPTDDFRMGVMRNNLTKVKQCLEHGILVDTVFSTGWTALMYAASYGKQEMVKLLLEKGADPNYSKESLTVLMVACSSTCSQEAEVLKCVSLLLDNKAEVNAYDRHHDTPLLNATKKGKVSVVKKLVEAGADLDKQDNNGYTAVMWAVRQNNLRMLHVLLDSGADYNRQNITGERAMDIASLNGFSKAEALLRAREDPGTTCDINSILESAPTSLMSTVEGPDRRDPLTRAAPAPPAPSTSPSPPAPHTATALPQTSMAALQAPGAGDMYRHGELQVFLSGLELSDLVPKFQHHDIQFHDFLRMTDKDLQQLGITQMGVRKRILDAIQDTHKVSWQTSSINVVQYNKHITCADAVAMVSNIKKHSSHISSSIGYITDQVRACPDILANAEEHCGAEELGIQAEDALTNVKFLYEELIVLRNFLTEVADRPQYKPADLIEPKSSKHRQNSWLSTKNLLLSGFLGGVLYYNRDTVTHCYHVICDKIASSYR